MHGGQERASRGGKVVGKKRANERKRTKLEKRASREERGGDEPA